MGRKVHDKKWVMPAGQRKVALMACSHAVNLCGDKQSGLYWQAAMVSRIRMLRVYQQTMTRQEDIDRADRTIEHLQAELFRV